MIELVIEARERDIGLPVARVLPHLRHRKVGPFVFVDHMGPIELAPGAGFDVRPHPHIGLSTVTYLYDGENVHRDSLGTVQINRPGDVNLMTAGRGVVHSERSSPELRARGGRMHGVQLWLGLPDRNEDDAPSFAHHPQATLPSITADGMQGRVLIGSAFGATSPIVHPSQPWLVDVALAGDVAIEDTVAERAMLVIEGTVRVDDTELVANQLAVLSGVAHVRGTARLLLLGGASLPPRMLDWNFVASDRDRLERARDRWKARGFPTIPGDDQEFVPYPELHR